MLSIGDNIKKLRELYNLSQGDLAKIAGVSDKAVSTWERGAREPRMGAIQKIAEHFGLKKSNLVENDGMKQIQSSTSIIQKKSDFYLSEQEKVLIKNYRELTDDEKCEVENIIAFKLQLRVQQNQDTQNEVG